MDILSLTSFSQIRGVMAVSSADLPDDTLENYDLETDLEVDLGGWLEQWEAIRDGDDHKAKKLKLYAKYRCAAWVAAAGQNFAYVQMTDGANAARRSDVEGFQELRKHLESRALAYRQDLLDELEEAAAGFRPAIGRVTPRRDPVTEGR